MSRTVFGIAGLGPIKEKTLIESGYATEEHLKKANEQDLLKLPGFGFSIVSKILEHYGRDFKYPDMEKIESYSSNNVIIDNKIIKPWRVHKKTEDVIVEPVDFELQKTTIWSFEKRGSWASHTSQYRGNWPPQIVRNLLLKYTEIGDLVLDSMVGGGTTPVECLITGRNSISIDVNPDAVLITRDRLNLPASIIKSLPETKHSTYVGDTRNLNLIADKSIDMIATHPPYVNIIKYTPCIPGDLSALNNYHLFFKEFRKAIREFYRVLKPGKVCAILIGDTHKNGHYVPIANRLMIDFLREGFILREDVIKKEWNCESDRYLKKYSNADFLLTMHEHLYIFEKPRNGMKYKDSSIEFFDE